MTSRPAGTRKRIAAASPAADAARDLVGGQRAAAAAVLRRQARGQRRLPLGLELLGRAEAVVRAAAPRPASLRDRRVAIEPLGLPVRAVRAADVGPFVPVEAQPSQVVEDAVLGFARRSLRVGVLDAQHERAAVAARQQPVEQRRARVADVQMSGRTRREADAHRVGRPRGRRPASTTACAAIASPRPTASTPSLVLPLTLTAIDGDAEHVAPALARISSTCGASFGRSRITVTSTFATRPARRRDDRDGAREQVEARRVLPARIGVRKVPADVAGAGGAEASRRRARGTRRRRRSGRAGRGRADSVTPASTSGRPSTSRCRS